MARRRYQCPEPFLENGWWSIRYRVDEYDAAGNLFRQRKYKRLALADTPIREVLKRRDEHLAPFNSGAVNAGAAVRFRDYVTQVYETTHVPLLDHNSQQSYKVLIRAYLVPAFGKLLLRDLTPQVIQVFFTKLAVTPRKIRIGKNKKYRVDILALASRKKIWETLSSILTSAVRYKHLAQNPAEGINLGGDTAGKRVKPFVSREQFAALLKLIPEPYATMVFVDVLTGLRISELVGLRWKNVHERSITIEQKFSRGHWGKPKTKASNATVGVVAAVIARIHALKSVQVSIKAGNATRIVPAVKSCGPNDLVFQSVYKRGPMSADNIRNRHLKPAARMLGIPWANWLCLRRSTATWHKKAGNHVKDAQAFLRHSRSGPTLDIYMQTEDESQREALDRLEKFAGVELPANSSPDQLPLWDSGGSGTKWVN